MPEIQVYPDGDHLARAAAELVARTASRAVRGHGRFDWCLSGGSTPRRCYELLAMPERSQMIDWAHVHIFWGDERCVPPTEPQSNYGMAKEALLSQVPIPSENIHRIEAELDPAEAASRYAALLKEQLGQRGGFDLALLGIGEDGHTASLFPGLPAVRETGNWVVAEFVIHLDMWRISLTPGVFNRSATVAFLAEGANKAEIVAKVIEGPKEVDKLPAQVIDPKDGQVIWLLDRSAAAQLEVKA